MKQNTRKKIAIFLRGIGWIAGALIILLLIYGILKNFNLI